MSIITVNYLAVSTRWEWYNGQSEAGYSSRWPSGCSTVPVSGKSNIYNLAIIESDEGISQNWDIRVSLWEILFYDKVKETFMVST